MILLIVIAWILIVAKAPVWIWFLFFIHTVSVIILWFDNGLNYLTEILKKINKL